MNSTNEKEHSAKHKFKRSDGFGPAIALMRRNARMSESELSEKTQIELFIVRSIEGNQKTPTFQELVLLAEACGYKISITCEPVRPTGINAASLEIHQI